ECQATGVVSHHGPEPRDLEGRVAEACTKDLPQRRWVGQIESRSAGRRFVCAEGRWVDDCAATALPRLRVAPAVHALHPDGRAGRILAVAEVRDPVGVLVVVADAVAERPDQVDVADLIPDERRLALDASLPGGATGTRARSRGHASADLPRLAGSL